MKAALLITKQTLWYIC